MAETMKSGPSADPQPAEASESARPARRPRPPKMLWPVIFGSVLALIAGTLVILWPVLQAAGAAIGVGMVVAILVLSLTPLLLLGGILRRGRHSRSSEKDEV